MDQRYRPRRSCLYMPGSNARAIEKAKSLDADVLIFDLEDAVAPDEKEAARQLVCDAVAAGGFGAREVVIRINDLNTEWGKDDLKSAVNSCPDVILTPKVSGARDVEQIDVATTKSGANDDLKLWVMIETPSAILNIAEIAGMAPHSRLSGFIMGTNDLAKELRIQPTPDRSAFQSALNLSVIAARANDIVVIDGVFNDIGNNQGFLDECTQGRVLGFDGKTLIHPSQIDECNRTFSPSSDEIDRAREIVAAFEIPENKGKGVVSVDGKMTELLHLEEARRILMIADAID